MNNLCTDPKYSTDGITATGSLPQNKMLTVTADSDGEYALVSRSNNKINYSLNTDTWLFRNMSQSRITYGGPATQPLEVNVDDGTQSIRPALRLDLNKVGFDTATYSFMDRSLIKSEPIVTAPTARALTYNGQAQALVDAGTAEGGTMKYALGTDGTNTPTGGWDITIPTGADAGTYYVWYCLKEPLI